MKQSGRAHPLILAALLGIVVVIALLFMGGEDVGATGARFLSSLAKSDAKTLTELTYLDGRDPKQIEENWKKSLELAKYYRFRWKIVSTSMTSDKIASVKIQVIRNSDSPGSYEENYGLPMVKENGRWKVQVSGLSRDMYPFLPK